MKDEEFLLTAFYKAKGLPYADKPFHYSCHTEPPMQSVCRSVVVLSLFDKHKFIFQ
jgi:hypothetical protein